MIYSPLVTRIPYISPLPWWVGIMGRGITTQLGLSHLFTLFAEPIKIQLMIDYLIACGFRHLLGPIRNVTEIQFNHVPAYLADDMVVVIL